MRKARWLLVMDRLGEPPRGCNETAQIQQQKSSMKWTIDPNHQIFQGDVSFQGGISSHPVGKCFRNTFTKILLNCMGWAPHVLRNTIVTNSHQAIQKLDENIFSKNYWTINLRNPQQDPLNGPLQPWVSNSSSNLLRGPSFGKVLFNFWWSHVFSLRWPFHFLHGSLSH